MPTCKYCGEEFNLSTARRSIGQRFWAGAYDDCFPDGDVCEDCARQEIDENMSAGADVMELMDWEWD